jgi:hypothetical protein
MIEINSLTDLSRKIDSGVRPLTGEACGLGIRVLCDFTAKGKQLLDEIMNFSSNWNSGSETDPHVGSVMLDPDWWPILAVFALLKEGNKEVFVATRDQEGHFQVRVAAAGAEDGYVEEWKSFMTERGWDIRTYKTSGTAGFRNRHEMTGRVT